MEGPGELVGADIPRLCEGWPHLEVFVRFDERVEDVLQDLEGEMGAVLLRIELIGLTGDRSDDISRRCVAEADPFTRRAGCECKDKRDDDADSGQHRRSRHRHHPEIVCTRLSTRDGPW